MGSIAVIETTVDTTIITGTDDSDFVDVVTTENLVEGRVYHVICSAATSTSNSDELFEWRLYDETNSEAVGGSTLIREMAQAGIPQPYYFVGRITAGATTGGLAFQQKGYAHTNPSTGFLPARTLFLSMLLLDMSDMDSGDYFFVNDDSSQIDEEDWESKVSYTETEIEAGDNWLVFAGTETSINNLFGSSEARIEYLASVGSRFPSIRVEGKNVDEHLLSWMCRSFHLSPNDVGGSVTWNLQAKSPATQGTSSYTLNATLFGIKVSSLADSFINFSQSGTSPTDAEFFEIDSNDFTPTSDGKVIVAATSIFDAGGTNRKAGQRIQRKITTIPNTVPDNTNFVNTNDSSDKLALSYITVYDGISGTVEPIGYDGKVSIYYSGIDFVETTLAIFGTTTTIPDVTFSAVAKQVYTSGDVESQTFDAGSKASQSHSSGDVEAEANP